MITFKCDGYTVAGHTTSDTYSTAIDVPRIGEKIVFSTEKDATFRVVDVERYYHEREQRNTITVYLQKFVNA